MKFIYEYGYKTQMHWACEQCIVRAMCIFDGCYMTDLMHYECMDCNKNKKCKEKCERVEHLILFDNFSRTYGPTLKKHLEEQSLFYKLSKIDHQKVNWEHHHTPA